MEEPEVVSPGPEELYEAIVFLGSFMESLYEVLRVTGSNPRPTEIEGVNLLVSMTNQVIRNVITVSGVYARQSASAIARNAEVEKLLGQR